MNAPAPVISRMRALTSIHILAMNEATSTVPRARKEINFSEKDIARFWAKVNKDGPIMPHMATPCWVWTAGKDGKGYGAFKLKGKQLSSHRTSWIIANKSIFPDAFYACHRCDNPVCCRPDHLFLGTAGDNARDRSSKGRSNSPRGEIHGMVKLTTSQIIEIRAIYAAGEMNHRELGLRFNVSREAIGVIIRRKRWAHIQPV